MNGNRLKGFSFTTMCNGRIDPDSPLSTDLFNDLREDPFYLQLWLDDDLRGAVMRFKEKCKKKGVEPSRDDLLKFAKKYLEIRGKN